MTLITGASSGIGRALAIRLSATRPLLLHGRNLERLDETLAHCANPEQHLIWPYDLQEIPSLAPNLSAFLTEKGVFIECFIHSAGIVKILPVRNADYQTLGTVMNVNFVSAVEIIALLMKKTVNRKHLTSVLLISSIASKFGAPGFSMYSASKGALDSLMRSLAVELAPRTRVNSILAGGVKTPMGDGLLADPAVLAKFEKDYPLGIGEPDDIVNTAEFLISNAARWITGQALAVDGGRSVNISV